jgi:hypothetical protein
MPRLQMDEKNCSRDPTLYASGQEKGVEKLREITY